MEQLRLLIWRGGMLYADFEGATEIPGGQFDAIRQWQWEII